MARLQARWPMEERPGSSASARGGFRGGDGRDQCDLGDAQNEDFVELFSRSVLGLQDLFGIWHSSCFLIRLRLRYCGLRI